jgi:hypothetical protein
VVAIHRLPVDDDATISDVQKSVSRWQRWRSRAAYTDLVMKRFNANGIEQSPVAWRHVPAVG